LHALLLLWQLLIFAAAARPHPTTPPFFGEGSTKKRKSPVASGMPFGHVSVVAVVEVAVQCKHYTSEVKSSQVNTLPKAKSKTRSKQNKDMHK
jgi:hypothetical protein